MLNSGLHAGGTSVQIGTLAAAGGTVTITWQEGAPVPSNTGSAATAYIGDKVLPATLPFFYFHVLTFY